MACSEGSIWQDASFIFILLSIVLVVGISGVMYLKVSSLSFEKEVTIDDMMVMFLIYCGKISNDVPHADNIATMREMRSIVFGTGKIYITLYQILNILPFVLDLQFPSRYTDVMSIASVLMFSLSGMATFTTCSFSTQVDSVTRLYLDTIFPMVFVVVVYLASRVHVALLSRWKGGGGHGVEQSQGEELCHVISSIRSKYYMTIPVMLNLVLPSLTASLFATFSCTDTDPADTVAGEDLYMTTDYSISCTSDRYKVARLWASLNIGLYCLLLPAFYFYELYRHRDDIRSRDTPVASASRDEARKLRIRPIRVLFDVYKPHFWFWEIIEMFWKMLMTGVLVLVGRGSARQVVVGIVITGLYAKIIETYEPLAVFHLQKLKHVTVVQVQYMLFLALLIRVDVCDPEATGVLVLCVGVFFGNVFADVYLRFSRERLHTYLENTFSALCVFSRSQRGTSNGNGREGRGGEKSGISAGAGASTGERSISLPVMSPLLLDKLTPAAISSPAPASAPPPSPELSEKGRGPRDHDYDDKVAGDNI